MVRFRIREARRGDGDAIGALWTELMTHHRALDARFTVSPDGRKQYTRHAIEMIRSRDARVLVAEDAASGSVIAYIIGELQSRPAKSLPGLYGFISDVCVHEQWRRDGLGRALCADMLAWFRSRGAKAVELYVAEANPAAIAFWTEMGLAPFLRLMHLDL